MKTYKNPTRAELERFMGRHVCIEFKDGMVEKGILRHDVMVGGQSPHKKRGYTIVNWTRPYKPYTHFLLSHVKNIKELEAGLEIGE